jgi:CPA2 family monovalent cation:H+ antiporter-2
LLRGISGMQGEMGISKIRIPNVEIATLPVKQGKNLVVGKTIKESGIRSNFGVTVLAVKRGEKYLTNVSPDLKICQDDILYVFGKPESIIKLNSFFISNQNPL